MQLERLSLSEYDLYIVIFFSNLKSYQIIYIKITRWLVDVSSFLGIHLLFLGLTELNIVFWELVSGQTPLAAGGQGEGGLQLPLWLSIACSVFPSPSENMVSFPEEGQALLAYMVLQAPSSG